MTDPEPHPLFRDYLPEYLQRRTAVPQTPGEPDHAAPTHPVEPKVKAATTAASASAVVTAFVLWLLDEVFWNGENIPPDVPLPVAMFVSLAVVGGPTFVAGYLARHVDRRV